MKTFLRIIGFVAILAALLVLPELDIFATGLWSWVLGFLGWLAWWAIVDYFYRDSPSPARVFNDEGKIKK